MDRTSLASRGQRLIGSTSRGRRRRLLFGVVAVVMLAAAFPALAGAGTDAPAPSKNIWDYAVFGWDSVNITGQNATMNGNIGVEKKGGSATICANGSLKMADHTAVVADNLQVSALCTLYDVFYGTAPSNPSLAAVKHHGEAHFDAPIGVNNAPAMPTWESWAQCDKSGTKDFTINSPGQTPTPKPTAPGTYGNVVMKDYGVLHLSSGMYVFCNVSMGKNAMFDVMPDTTVIVAGTMSAGNYSYIGHAARKNVAATDNALIYVRGDAAGKAQPCHFADPAQTVLIACVSSSVVNMAKHATVHATFYARYGNINLGHDSGLFGHFWARTLNSDVAIHVTGGSTTTTSTTTVPEPPTTVETPTTVPETPTTEPG